MKLNNVTTINADDYKEEDRQTVAQLANIINPFMQQVVELADSRIDFDNMTRTLKQLDVTVNSSGIPIQATVLSTGKSAVYGTKVINAQNLTKATTYPTSAPYIVYTLQAGGSIKIERVYGVVPGNKFRLTIEIL